jgi:hypothetical protein
MNTGRTPRARYARFCMLTGNDAFVFIFSVAQQKDRPVAELTEALDNKWGT